MKNATHNQNIAPGETVSIGFNGRDGHVVDKPYNYVLIESVCEAIEYVQLADGKIDKDYLYRAVYTNLLLQGLPVDNVLLSDDYDGDGLTLDKEYEYDTNPFSADSDEDGLGDYEEIYIYNTNPNMWDTDGDLMSDGTEVSSGLNPLVKDTDGNGVLDNVEIISQGVRLYSIETYDISDTEVLPMVSIVGKGDFSKKLYAQKIEHDKTILDLDCLVGTPFDFVHEEDMQFESSDLTFKISDNVLQNNNIEDLAIAYYDEEENILQLLNTSYDVENNNITASVDHYSKYMVVSVPKYLYNIDLENKSSIIKSGKADVVFVIDTTGSMSSPIRNVRDNINQFVTKLEENNIDIRLGLVEYRDIYADGIGSTKSYDWYTDVLDFKTKLASLGISGGGDTPESAVDTLHCAQNMNFRTGVKKYIILVTDANFKNGIVGDSSVTMQDEIDTLVKDDIVTSVITTPYYYTEYNPLIINTDGVIGNIAKNFAVELEPLIDKMIDKVNNGCWVRLSNGEIVYLEKDPSLGDETIDTDKDGIPDIVELKSTYETRVFNPYTYTYELIETWTFFSNPAKEDTDGDGLYDVDDLRPSIFDTVILADTELVTVFNTGRVWYKIACNSFDYLDNLTYMGNLIPKNPIDIGTFKGILNNVEKNNKQSFNIDELACIGFIDNEGSKIYMHNKSGDLRETIFRRITNEESNYIRHSGILKWEEWKEVPKGTKSGFFKGKVLSAADINFSLKLYYVVDVYTVLNAIVYAGAIVIIVIVALKATPVVLANIQGIIYYIKTFGVVEGLKMYQYLGIDNLPDSVITWILWDVADGDSIADDIVLAIQTESVNIKLEKYLLNPEHPVGSSKAKWFELALGFNKANIADLAKQIVFNEKMADLTAVTEYGTKFSQFISIVGANGRVIDVEFIWIKNLDGFIKLVTAIPTK